MKYLKFLAIVVFFSSCSSMQSPPPAIDLVNKGLLRADLSIVDFGTMKGLKPARLYFVELQSKTEFKSERIIASERIDADGMIYVNLVPGLYAIVASDRSYDGFLVYTLFNEDLISRSVVKIEKGETKVLKFRVLDYADTVFDKTPAVTRYYRNAVCRNKGDHVRLTIGKFYDSPESKKQIVEEKKEAEKVGKKMEIY